VDIGDFKQAIGAMEKLMDLEQKKPIDELPLEIIATELLESANEEQNNKNLDLGELKNSVLSIFARANARQSLSPKVLIKLIIRVRIFIKSLNITKNIG
jgi:hypothetical protein